MSTSNHPFSQGNSGSANEGNDPGGWTNDPTGGHRPQFDAPVSGGGQLGGSQFGGGQFGGGQFGGPGPNSSPTADEPEAAGDGHLDTAYANTAYPNTAHPNGAHASDPNRGAAFGTAYGNPPVSGNPPQSTGAPTTERKPRRRGWLAVPAVALVAALGASGLTASLLNNDSASAGGSNTVTTRVVQGQTSAPDWSATAQAASPSVVSIQVSSRQGAAEGSGVVLDTEGHIATNNHVVAAAGTGATLQVTDSEQHVYNATVVGTDPATDLAVIKIENPPASLTPMVLADADALSVGQPVMAIGNPLGLSETVTTGIISALDRPVITEQQSSQSPYGARTSADSQATQSVANAIQTNAAINPGNSGGALVNADGQLIGIPSSIASLGSSSSSSSESGNIGIGFAIPVNEVKSVTAQLIDHGTAEHSWLGVATSDQLAQVDGASVRGAQIATVADNSPASAAKLQDGDVVTGINGDPVNGAEALMAQIWDHAVGEKITLEIVREGQSREVEVTLATAPQ